MIKPVKRNKRLKWSESRYGIQLRNKRFLKIVQASSIIAQGKAKHRAICSSTNNVYGKPAFIVINTLQTMKAVSEVMK